MKRHILILTAILVPGFVASVWLTPVDAPFDHALLAARDSTDFHED